MHLTVIKLKYMKMNFSPAKTAGRLFLAAAMLLALKGNSQTYNNYYMEGADHIWGPGQARSLITHNAACAMTTTGSWFDTDYTSDFLFTQIKPNGLHHLSWRFGRPGMSEYGNSICQSIVNANEFIICGRSANYQMLVMKVNSSGTVIWSKEIAFPYAMVEGVVVASFNNSPSHNGYIVSGYANGVAGNAALVAVRFSETGTVVWKYEYPVPVKVIVTDAIVRHLHNDRLFSITGYENTGNVFYANFSTLDGSIFSYAPGGRYNLSSPASLGAVRMTEYLKSGVQQLAFVVAKEGYPYSILAFGVQDNSAVFTPVWSYTYTSSTPYYYHVASIVNLSSSKLCVLASAPTGFANASSVTMLMNLDYSGGVLDARFYNATHEVAASLVETCGSGYPAFSANYIAGADQSYLRVVKRTAATMPGCNSALTMTAASANVPVQPLSISRVASGTEGNYSVMATSVPALAYNCLGSPLRLAASQTGEETEELASGNAYPNPAHGFVTVQAGDEPVSVELFAINGQLLWSRQITGTTQLSLDNTGPGVYILRKVHANGRAEIEKLIVE